MRFTLKKLLCASVVATSILSVNNALANKVETVKSTTTHCNKTEVPYVPGWPQQHIAMGNLTDGTSSALASIQAANVPVNTLFKYAGPNGGGDRGKLVYPTITQEIIDQTAALNTNALPTMVVYTAEMSGGTNYCDFANSSDHPTIPCNEDVQQNLDKHLVNLALLAQMLHQANNGGSIVLNPDLLGQITQNKLETTLDKMTIPVQHAINVAAYVLQATPHLKLPLPNTDPSKPVQYKTFDGTLYSDYQWILANVYGGKDYWDAGFTDLMPALVNAAFTEAEAKAATTPPGVPTFANTFAGWVQANNWLIQNYGGSNVSYGWLENVWSPGTANWIHQGKMSDDAINTAYTQPVMSVLQKYNVYDGAYRPSYIAFDKYERDVVPSAVNNYLFNQNDWHNYLTAAKQVSEQTANDGNATPVMLFQIPGGHVLTQQNAPASMFEHISTAPDYIFGDSYLDKNLSGAININETGLGGGYLDYTLPSNYNCNGCNIKQYLTMDQQDWTQKHINNLIDSHVFAVLWGGGTGPTTSMTNYPVDDQGWLANKINQYDN